VKVLLVGGSGMVGTFITPYLARHHELRVLDVRPPQHADLVEYVEGSISDPEAVARALGGMDSFINLVMRGANDEGLPAILNNHEVNVLGLHLLLWTAQGMGIRAGVHTSTMTVHDRTRTWYPAEETVALDSPGVYGLTKGLGEQICQYFARWHDMRLIALRITGPRARAAYLAERRTPIYPGLYVTDEEDLANAYLSALEVVKVGKGRFDAVFIAGDEHEKEHNLTKARVLLGWAPLSQRLLED
jgi:nucleoside-diphosphate-sugar epimerase